MRSMENEFTCRPYDLDFPLQVSRDMDAILNGRSASRRLSRKIRMPNRQLLYVCQPNVT